MAASNLPYNPKFLSYRVISDILGFTPYADNQSVDPSCDPLGATYVNVVPSVHPGPVGVTSVTGYAPSVSLGTELLLLTVNGFLDTGSSVQYAQFFDHSPVLNDIPINSFRLAVGAAYSWTPSFPRICAALYMAVSTTPNKFTASTEKAWVYAEISA